MKHHVQNRLPFSLWPVSSTLNDLLVGQQPKKFLAGYYTNPNNSLYGNHQPFLDQAATFVVSIDGLTADSRIDSVTFQFNTAGGTYVSTIPEPTSLATWAGIAGLGAAGVGFRRRRSAEGKGRWSKKNREGLLCIIAKRGGEHPRNLTFSPAWMDAAAWSRYNPCVASLEAVAGEIAARHCATRLRPGFAL